jgi:DNA-binding CsgD family transcriptional regulator
MGSPEPAAPVRLDLSWSMEQQNQSSSHRDEIDLLGRTGERDSSSPTGCDVRRRDVAGDGEGRAGFSSTEAVVQPSVSAHPEGMTCASPTGRADEATVDQAQVHLALAAVSYMSGHVARSKAEAEAVLAERGLPASLYAAAEQSRLLALLSDGSISTITRAVPPSALLARAALAWRGGRVGETLDMLWAAARAADGNGGPGCYPGLGLTTVYSALGQFDDARACLLAVADEIALIGDPLWAAAPAVFSSRIELAAGRLDAAKAAATAGVDTARELGTPPLAPIGHGVLVAVALHRGELAEAAHLQTQWQAELLATRLPFGTPNRPWTMLRLAEAQKRPILGTGTSHAFDLVAGDHSLLLEEPGAAAWLVRVARHAGDDERAGAVTVTVERLAAANPRVPTVVAAATHARGVVDRDAERLAAAAERYRSPWARASAAEDCAAVRAQRGERAAARSWLERAGEDYLRCGATRDHARIRSRLRDLGVRRRHWSRQDRPVSGWASLTETEHAVAELVAEGLSNQQVAGRMFLSRHTVDFHLRRIFHKLSIDSRVVLARIALSNADAPS